MKRICLLLFSCCLCCVNLCAKEGKLHFQVMNEHHEPIAYASFTLYTNDGTMVKDDMISDEQGQVVIEELCSGEYILQQTSTQRGYLIEEKEISFTYEEGKDQQLIDVINQEATANVVVQIIDEKGKAKAHTSFHLLYKDGRKELLYSDDQGYQTLKGLKIGEYTIEMKDQKVSFFVTKGNYDSDYILKVKDKKKETFSVKKKDPSLWILLLVLSVGCFLVCLVLKGWLIQFLKKEGTDF